MRRYLSGFLLFFLAIEKVSAVAPQLYVTGTSVTSLSLSECLHLLGLAGARECILADFHNDDKVKLQSNEAKYWRGTELVMLGGCDFNGAQTAGPAETDLITTERWAQAALGEMMETKEAATYKKKAQARTDQSGERC